MTNKNCICIKYVRTGIGFKERLHIKAFNNINDRGAFLSKQVDNQWGEADLDSGHGYPDKTGIYAKAGGVWHNVRKLDPSILAHI